MTATLTVVGAVMLLIVGLYAKAHKEAKEAK